MWRIHFRTMSIPAVSSFNVLAGTGAGRAEPFAADLCVVTEDQTGDGSVDMSQASAAVLFDVNNKKVLYSKNAHERLYPASLTKVVDGTGGITECVTGYCADSYG